MTSEEEKTRRPKDSKFHQQKLPAWQPLLTARSVFPLFFVTGVIFLPLGAIFFLSSNSVSEVVIPYTHCIKEGTNTKCSDEVKNVAFFSTYKTCKCRESFNLSTPMEGNVYMYYGLTNFYQNHRRYAKNRDDQQLLGRAVSSLTWECEPFRTIDVFVKGKKTTKNVAPCGAIANSLFNDTFRLFYKGERGDESIEIGLLNKGIAWKSDTNIKFGIPSNETWSKSHKPISWPVPAYVRAPDAYPGDEDLLVWMRTAALPNFRKLHRRINHTADIKFKTGLPKGYYELEVQYAFPVTSFGGEKKIFLSNTSWIGGRNPMLGITYLVIGVAHIILGIIFLVIHIQAKKRRVEWDFSENFSEND